MSLYRPRSAAEEPDARLEKWQVHEAVTDGETTMHFVGRVIGQDGRVSSQIVSFDRASMTGVTRSGRRYRLDGDPGLDPDASYVWSHWRRINGVQSSSEVTLDRLEEVLAASAARSAPL